MHQSLCRPACAHASVLSSGTMHPCMAVHTLVRYIYTGPKNRCAGTSYYDNCQIAHLRLHARSKGLCQGVLTDSHPSPGASAAAERPLLAGERKASSGEAGGVCRACTARPTSATPKASPSPPAPADPAARRLLQPHKVPAVCLQQQGQLKLNNLALAWYHL